MKHSQPRAPQNHGSKPLTNPTSTTTTLYQCAIIAYLAVTYILHDHPRHVRYRGTVENAQKPVLKAGHRHDLSSEHHTKIRSSQAPYTHRVADEGSDEVHRKGTRSSPREVPRESSSLPPRWNNLRDHHDWPKKSSARLRQIKDPRLSKEQMNEAWIHMRAVRPMKRVHWGPVHFHEYEYPSDDGKESTVRREDVPRGKRQARQPIQKKKQPARELWGAVKDNDVFGQVDDDDIWGDVKTGEHR